MNLIKELEEKGACQEAIEWIRSNNFKTPQEAWDACERGDWMLWAMYNFELCDLQTFTLAKAKIAQEVRHLMRDPRSGAALDAAFAFDKGHLSRDGLNTACSAAYAAAAAYAAYAYAADTAAAAYAAYAAAYAADAAAAAAYAAAADAAYAASYAAAAADADTAAAARSKALLKSAEICREVLPIVKLTSK